MSSETHQNPPSQEGEGKWYAIYTCVHQEKKVAERLEVRGIEFYLPLYRTWRQRRDSRVALSLPLFPGYLFVHLPVQQRLRVLEVPSVVRMVGPPAGPLAVSVEELSRLRQGLSGQVYAEPHQYLTIGCRVRVVNGPFANWEAVLLRRRQGWRAVLSLDLIMSSFTVEVSENDIERL